MAIVGQLLVLVGVNNAGLTAGLASSQAQLKGFSGAAAASMAVVRTAVVGAGIATGVGLILGVKAAADFQDAFAGVRKTVDEADLAAAGLTFEELAQQIRDMALEIPVAATELAAIAEAAGALGIKAADIEAFTRTVALLGVTTDLTTGAAAEALGKLGTILNLTGGDFEDFADILVALGNNGASTESAIIEVAKRFAAAGVQAGLSTAEILAFSSAITSAGVEPEAAGTSLSRLFGNMILGTANATKSGRAFATLTGKSFKDFSKLVKTDTVGAMLLVLSSLKGLDKFQQARALKSIGITNSRDVNAIRALAMTYETNLLPAIETAETATGALATEAEKRFDTFNSKLALLGNNFTELLITIGTPLLPPLTAFVASVTGAVRSVSEWVAAGAQLGSTFGPVVQTIMTRLGELWSIAQEVGEVIMDFATRVWEGGLNKAIGAAADLIGSVIDVIGGIATAILENQDAMNILKTVADGIGTGFGIAADAVGILLDYLGNLGDTIRANEALMQTLEDIGNGIAGAFQAAQPAILAIVGDLEKLVTLAGEAAAWLATLAGGTPEDERPGRDLPPGLGDERPGRTTGTPAAPLPADQLVWPWGPKNTPRYDLGPFKNIFGGDSTLPIPGGGSREYEMPGLGGAIGPNGSTIPLNTKNWMAERFGPSAPIQLNNTSNIYLDGDKIGEINDRRQFNNASQASSGFTHGALP